MNLLDKIILKISKKMYIKRFIIKNYTDLTFKRYGDTLFVDIFVYHGIYLGDESFYRKDLKFQHYYNHLDRNLHYKKNNEIFIQEQVDEYYKYFFNDFQKILLNNKLEEKLQSKEVKIKRSKI